MLELYVQNYSFSFHASKYKQYTGECGALVVSKTKLSTFPSLWLLQKRVHGYSVVKPFPFPGL